MTQQGKQDQSSKPSQQGSSNAHGDKTSPNKQMQGGTHAGQLGPEGASSRKDHA